VDGAHRRAWRYQHYESVHGLWVRIAPLLQQQQDVRASAPKNFTLLKHLDLTWAIDGRGEDGVMFVSPSTYHNKDGATYGYTWIHGDSSSPRSAMPEWLTKIMNAALEPPPAVARQTTSISASISLETTTIHGVSEAV
jgi:hypothetical protein